MAEIDPYAPCPCGSGQKFKWCCQKVESYATKAERLMDNGQTDAALQTLDEGLRKAPDNPWLATRKALILFRRRKPEQARPILERVIAKMPGHVGAQAILIQVLAVIEGAQAAAQALQRMLLICPADQSPVVSAIFQLVAVWLTESDKIPAAISHMRVARKGVGEDEFDPRMLDAIYNNPTYAPWLKEPYELSPAPEGLSDSARARFENALKQAEQARWAVAAEDFEKLAAEGVVVADRNAGLCRLWFADDSNASAALARYIAKIGPVEEAVDLEALRQLIAPISGSDSVEIIRLVWPLRDREGLLKKLRERPDMVDEGRRSLEPDDPQSPETDFFFLLDRDLDEEAAVARLEDFPRIVARFHVGQDFAVLEAADDGKLDGLSDRFREIAGSTIPPAHPKTKVVLKVPRHILALREEWFIPDSVDERTLNHWRKRELDRVYREIWTKTPFPWLNNRTVEQAAKAGDVEISLRAGLLRGRWELGENQATIDFLQKELGIPAEPEIDPRSVDIDRLSLGRFPLVPIDRLDDDKLLAFLKRADEYGMPIPSRAAAAEIVKRPELFETDKADRFAIHSLLASLEMREGRKDEAYSWIDRGLAAESPSERAENLARWDMLRIRIRAEFEPPETWVPELAAILEGQTKNSKPKEPVILGLLEMGLIRIEPHPEKEGDVMLDTSPLQALIRQYGPRITTAEGTLGVSVAKGGIWTPGGSTSSGGGAIWTPGTGSPPPPGESEKEKPKLFIPG